MSRSAIYVANTASNALTVGSAIPLGNIVRRYGCNLGVVGDSIAVRGAGYYDIDAAFDILGTAAGNVTITLYKDGMPITGAEATVTTAAATAYHVAIPALIKNNCNCDESLITAILSGTAATITNVGVVVEKE